MSDLRIQGDRTVFRGVSGIYVRARGLDARWDNADVLELDDASFRHWLHSRSNGQNEDGVKWPSETAVLLANNLRAICEEFDIRAVESADD